MAIPLKNALLAAWSTNFSTRLLATPTTFGCTASQATAYTALHAPFIAAYEAAAAPGARSAALVSARNQAKANLLPYARELYAFIQANRSVTPADRDLIGVKNRDTQPSPIPAPSTSPDIDLIRVSGRTVSMRLHSASTPGRRKPDGVRGASVFSFVGATPPTTAAGWTFEGNTTASTFDVTFPESVVPGTTVWVTAFWYNAKAQSGPAAPPVSTQIQFGSVPMVEVARKSKRRAA